MANSLAQKLRIKEGMKLNTIHAPANFADNLQPLPINITIGEKLRKYDQLHWFVANKTQLDNEYNRRTK